MKKSYLQADRAEDVQLARQVMHVVTQNEGIGRDQQASIMAPQQISYPGFRSPSRLSPLVNQAMQAVATNEGTCDKQASVPMMTPEYNRYPGYMSPTGSTPPGALAMESPLLFGRGGSNLERSGLHNGLGKTRKLNFLNGAHYTRTLKESARREVKQK